MADPAAAPTRPRPAGAPATASPGRPDADQILAQAARAAELSSATLDRIESAAAELEADIATARRAQDELQARAGVAAEKAVRAAEAASASAGVAKQASARAVAAARVVGRYLVIGFILVLLQVAIVVALASTSR